MPRSEPARGSLLRRLALAAAVFAATFALHTAQASPDAEKYMQGVIDQGFSILSEKTGDDAARKAKFHTFVLQHVDAEKTALFALGQYRRGASDADLAPYVAAFRDYITAVYEARLGERQTQELKVVGSVDNKAGDVTVNAQAKD